MKHIFLLPVFLICATAAAQEIEFAEGVYYGTAKVAMTVSSTGARTFTIVGKVRITPSSTPTDPTPTLNPFEKEVAQLTTDTLQKGGTPTTAAGISSVYSIVGDSVSSGKIAPEQALQAISAGVRLILSKQTDKDKWDKFRQDIGDALDTLRQEGVLKTKEEYSKVCKEVARGMNSVTGFNGSYSNPGLAIEKNAGLFGNIDIQAIIELIKLLMELFKTFFK